MTNKKDASATALGPTQQDWKAILSDTGCRFVWAIVGPAAEQLGGILGDQMKSFRASNINRLSHKWRNKLRERQISEDAIKHLPFGDALRGLEAVSLEEDDSVQELWAELFASAVDPKRDVPIKKFYIDILRCMSSPEVSLLNLLWECERTIALIQNRLWVALEDSDESASNVNEFNRAMNELAERTWRRFSAEDQASALQNLVRLQCIAFIPAPPQIRTLFGIPNDGVFQRSAFDKYGLVNVAEFTKLLQYLEDALYVATGLKDYREMKLMQYPRRYHLAGPINVPEMKCVLTPIAKDLLKACKDEAATAATG